MHWKSYSKVTKKRTAHKCNMNHSTLSKIDIFRCVLVVNNRKIEDNQKNFLNVPERKRTRCSNLLEIKKRWLMLLAMILIIPAFVFIGINGYSRLNPDANAIAKVDGKGSSLKNLMLLSAIILKESESNRVVRWILHCLTLGSKCSNSL